MRTGLGRAKIQTIAVAVALLPAVGLAARFAIEGFGANPIEDLTHVTGEWGLRFLLLSLAVTPLRQWLGWSWAAPLRRTLGLVAFAYATLHLATWAFLDLGLDGAAIFEDLTERPYVMVGMVAFLLLAALAATSTRRSIRRLGAARWRRLHACVYPAAVLAILHFFWLVKADYRSPIVHGMVLLTLLAARFVWKHRSTHGAEPD